MGDSVLCLRSDRLYFPATDASRSCIDRFANTQFEHIEDDGLSGYILPGLISGDL